MSIYVDRRVDGSLSLYIDGDLQLDTRDERLYHEALVLPALAIATRRRQGKMKALIIGGGDGLAARELLKSDAIATIDLVDYDARILQFAREELANVNENSLSSKRVVAHCMDAWDFVRSCADKKTTYDLVIVDLTVPQDVASAKFHTIEWYQLIARTLSIDGIVAVNGASPCQTADAYWSIYNSMRVAGLHPRPYRIPLQSFKDYGYGPDWGFFIVAQEPIEKSELTMDLFWVEPRHHLKLASSVLKMFLFPEIVAARRALSKPTRIGSDLLLSYFNNEQSVDASSIDWDGLGFERDPVVLPDIDAGDGIFPAGMRSDLASVLQVTSDQDLLFERVTYLMPPLRRAQTKEMIAEFLRNPARFLDGIDLSALVTSLIARASELPTILVDELKLLRDKIRGFLGDSTALLKLGMRITAIIVLVVIMGNLIYPDAAYGKGTGMHIDGLSGEPIGLSRPGHTRFANFGAEPEMATGDGFRNNRYNRGVSVDERGYVYPGRTYYGYCRTYYRSPRHRREHHEMPNQQIAPYRLTPEADILADGTVVIAISDRAYLQIRDDASTLIDIKSAEPIVDLRRDPAQVWRIGNEIRRQRLGLLKTIDAKNKWNNWLSWMDFTPWYSEDHVELKNLHDSLERLNLAEKNLGTIPKEMPAVAPAPANGAIELFSGVWMNGSGSSLIVKTKDGSLALFDGRQWSCKQRSTKELPETNTPKLKAVVLSFLNSEVKDNGAYVARLQENLKDAQTDRRALERDKADYNACSRNTRPTDLVEYGTLRIPLKDAVRRTQEDLDKTQQRIQLIEQQILEWPAEIYVARLMIDTLSKT